MATRDFNIMKGMMVNLEAGLLLPFMLNPQPITHSKAVTWDIEEIAGLPAPIYYYQSGGAKTISFQLFYDTSNVGAGLGAFSTVSSQGTLGFEAILESFLYPQSVDFSDFKLSSLARQRKFIAPPLVTLVIGLRFWKGYVMAAPMEETRFDKSLTPLQFTSQIEFSVVEDGVINDLNTTARNSRALLQSAINSIDVVSNAVENSADLIDFNFSISL